MNEVFIVLFSLSRSTSFVGRLHGRPRGNFNLGVLFLSRPTVNTYLILYIAILFYRIRFILIYFFYIYKSVFNLINYFIYSIFIALSVSFMRIIYSVYRLVSVIISLV